MSLLEQISKAKLYARKAKNLETVAILSTLESEANNVGKSKGNRISTDEEVVAVIKKTVKAAEETIVALQKTNPSDSRITSLLSEVELYKTFLPKQLTRDELTVIISTLIGSGINVKGKIMGELKSKYAGLYDGALASSIISSLLD